MGLCLRIMAVVVGVALVIAPAMRPLPGQDSGAGQDSAAAIGAPVTAVAQTPDGKWLAAGDEGLFLFHRYSLKKLKKIDCQLEKIYAIKFSPGQRGVAVVGGTPGELGAIDIYSYPAFKLLHHIEPHDDVAADIAWLNESTLVAGDMSGVCARIELAGPDGKVDVKSTAVHSKGLLSVERLDEASVVSAGLDNAIRVSWFGPATGSRKTRSLNNHTAPVNDLAVNQRGPAGAPKMVVSASNDYSIRFWQPAIGRMVRFVRLDSIPNCVVWDRSGKLAIAGCRNGEIVLIESANARIKQTIDAKVGWVNCLAISADGYRLFVGGVDGMVVVDLE